MPKTEEIHASTESLASGICFNIQTWQPWFLETILLTQCAQNISDFGKGYVQLNIS